MSPIPLSMYLVVAAALFCLGLYGALSRRNAVAIPIRIATAMPPELKGLFEEKKGPAEEPEAAQKEAAEPATVGAEHSTPVPEEKR